MDWASFAALNEGEKKCLWSILDRFLTQWPVFAFAHDGEPLFVFERQATRAN
jgi:hypothetical protein